MKNMIYQKNYYGIYIVLWCLIELVVIMLVMNIWIISELLSILIKETRYKNRFILGKS